MGFLMGHSAWQIDQFPTCWPMNGLFVHWSRGWGVSSFSERLVTVTFHFYAFIDKRNIQVLCKPCSLSSICDFLLDTVTPQPLQQSKSSRVCWKCLRKLMCNVIFIGLYGPSLAKNVHFWRLLDFINRLHWSTSNQVIDMSWNLYVQGPIHWQIMTQPMAKNVHFRMIFKFVNTIKLCTVIRGKELCNKNKLALFSYSLLLSVMTLLKYIHICIVIIPFI